MSAPNAAVGQPYVIGDDLMIRARIGELFGQRREHLAQLDRIPARAPPSPRREHPLPDRAAVAAVQAVARAQSEIETLEVRIRNAPAPEMDRINQRHCTERATLEKLAAVDLDLVSAVIDLHAAWQRRQQVLSILTSG